MIGHIETVNKNICGILIPVKKAAIHQDDSEINTPYFITLNISPCK